MSPTSNLRQDPNNLKPCLLGPKFGLRSDAKAGADADVGAADADVGAGVVADVDAGAGAVMLVLVLFNQASPSVSSSLTLINLWV